MVKQLNPKAKVIQTSKSAVDLKEILHTGLYNASEFSSTQVQQFYSFINSIKIK